MVTNTSLEVIFANSQALELLDTRLGRIRKKSIKEILYFCEETTLDQVRNLGSGEVASFEEILRSGEGGEFRIKARVRCFQSGEHFHYLWIFLDYTEEQQSRQEMIDFMADLSRAKAKIQEYAGRIEIYQRIVNNINQGLLVLDEKRKILVRNTAAEGILGWDPEEPASADGILQAVSHPGDLPLESLDALEEALDDGPVRGEILVLNRREEQEVRCFLTVFLLDGEENGLWVWNFIEIKEDLDRQQELIDYSAELTAVNRELQEKNREILRLSRLDVMTGVWNRSWILECLEQEMEKAGQAGEELALILFDVDDFKAINDRYGHLFGDDVLRGMTSLVRAEMEDRGLTGRYGGEEFLVILPGHRLEEAVESAEALRGKINQLSFPFDGREECLGVSLGVAALREGDTLDDLLYRADMAMYAGKGRGKNCVVSAVDEGL